MYKSSLALTCITWGPNPLLLLPSLKHTLRHCSLCLPLSLSPLRPAPCSYFNAFPAIMLIMCSALGSFCRLLLLSSSSSVCCCLPSFGLSSSSLPFPYLLLSLLLLLFSVVFFQFCLVVASVCLLILFICFCAKLFVVAGPPPSLSLSLYRSPIRPFIVYSLSLYVLSTKC